MALADFSITDIAGQAAGYLSDDFGGQGGGG